jgi:hypothetical protein
VTAPDTATVVVVVDVVVDVFRGTVVRGTVVGGTVVDDVVVV